jgi:hypothetical protein
MRRLLQCEGVAPRAGWAGLEQMCSVAQRRGAVQDTGHSMQLLHVDEYGWMWWRELEKRKGHHLCVGREGVRRRSGTMGLFCFGGSGAGSGSMDV